MIGAKSLMGNSWPDLDMLPFGWLTDGASCWSKSIYVDWICFSIDLYID